MQEVDCRDVAPHLLLRPDWPSQTMGVSMRRVAAASLQVCSVVMKDPALASIVPMAPFIRPEAGCRAATLAVIPSNQH